MKTLIKILILLMIFGCNSPIKTNVIQSSFNINESKELSVFVFNYVPDIYEFQLGGKKYRIKEVWVEKIWEYENLNKKIRVLEGMSGYLSFKDEFDLDGISFSYLERLSGIKGSKLTFDLVNYPQYLKIIFVDENNNQKEILLTKER